MSDQALHFITGRCGQIGHISTVKGLMRDRRRGGLAGPSPLTIVLAQLQLALHFAPKVQAQVSNLSGIRDHVLDCNEF